MDEQLHEWKSAAEALEEKVAESAGWIEGFSEKDEVGSKGKGEGYDRNP